MVRKTEKIISGIFWGFLTVGILLCPVLGILGFRPNIVLSGSMEPAVSTGSICILNTNFVYQDVEVDDIIVFYQGDTRVMHRAIDITNQGIETKGDNNKYSDGITTTRENFIGKVVLVIPHLGYLLQAVLTARGKILILTVAAALLLCAIFLPEKNDQEYTKRMNKIKGKH